MIAFGYNVENKSPCLFKAGLLFRKESLWVGVHYSTYNKRWCINLVPCVTLWITRPGGNTP